MGFTTKAEAPQPNSFETQIIKPIDNRTFALGKFFEHYKCPQPYYIDELITYADQYQIDYRLVAAISLKESSCGQHYRYNNFWGWVSARAGFLTVQDGIKFESELFSPNCNLSQFKDRNVVVKNPCNPFKGKSLQQQLSIYGPHDNSGYAKSVINLMNQIENSQNK